MLDKLLQIRAEKRREILVQAEETEANKIEELEARLAKIEELVDALGGKKFVEEELAEPEHSGQEEVTIELGADDEECEACDKDMEMDLDDQLAQLLADDEEIEVTAEDRRAWREKVAADYELKLDAEVGCDTDMPIGKSNTLEGLDSKTPEAEVEGIVEMHAKIMKEVQNLPKVKEAMEHLGTMLKEGKLVVADLEDEEKLQALAVDADAAKYWKEYFGQASDQESKEFGDDLVKEYETKKATASVDEVRVKMRRAYDLALDMQDRGMIGSSRSAVDAQVDELMKFSNDSFESFKKAVEKVSKPTVKIAAPALNVGVTDETEAPVQKDVSLNSQLKKLW